MPLIRLPLLSPRRRRGAPANAAALWRDLQGVLAVHGLTNLRMDIRQIDQVVDIEIEAVEA